MTGPLAGSPAQNANTDLLEQALAIGFPVLRDASRSLSTRQPSA